MVKTPKMTHDEGKIRSNDGGHSKDTKKKAAVTTVIRVKRRRNEPVPPDRLRFEPTTNHSNSSSRKRARRYENEVNHVLSHLSLSASPSLKNTTNNDSFTNSNNNNINFPTNVASPTVIFKRSTAEEDDSAQNKNKRKKEESTIIHIVDTQLDSDGGLRDQMGHLPKRAKLSLKMVETRTITAYELWELQSSNKSNENSKVSNNNDTEKKNISSISFRNRMRRKATQQQKQISSINHNGINHIRRSSSSNNNKVTAILDPLTRMIDESLVTISQIGSEKIMSHFDLLQTHRHNLSSKQYNRLINWTCSNGTGSILHQAVIFQHLDAVKIACNVLQIDTNLLDSEERTSFQISQLMKNNDCDANNAIMSILSQYEKPLPLTNNNEDREKEGDYVYDLYYMETKKNDNESSNSNGGEENHPNARPGMTLKKDVPSSIETIHRDNTSKHESISSETRNSSVVNQTTIEISGGIGYWNELGELVMEAEPMSFENEMVDRGQLHNKMENDIEDDSNDEDFYANDYPDEENEEKESAYYNNVYNPGYYDELDANQNPVYLKAAMINNYNESNNTFSISNSRRAEYSDDSDNNDDEIIQMHCTDFRNYPVDWGQDGNIGCNSSSSVSTNDSTNNFWNNEAHKLGLNNSNHAKNYNVKSGHESNDDDSDDDYRGFMYGEQKPYQRNKKRIYGAEINNYTYDSDLDVK